MAEFYKYIHNNYQLNTVKDFLTQNGLSVANFYNNKVDEFLGLKGEFRGGDKEPGSNLESIEYLYTDEELEENKDKPSGEKLLKVGTILYIPLDKVNVDGITGTLPDLKAVSNLGAFIAPKMEELFNNPSYKAEYRNRTGSYRTETSDVTVIIWSRAFSDEQNGEGLSGGFIDISAFVQQLDTDVDKESGGKFTLQLPALLAEKVPESSSFLDSGKWSVDKQSVYNYLKSNNQVLAYTQARKKGKIGVDERADFFFEKVLQSNDLIFIGFEKTENESRNTSFQTYSNRVARGNYDMIGMIDKVDQTLDFKQNQISINVTGRDLTKTVIEDGCYFYPDAFGVDNIFAQSQDSDRFFDRIYGSLQTLGAFAFRSIQYSMGFIINQLQNTGYVPDTVFSGWGSERNKMYKPKTDNKSKKLLKQLKDDNKGISYTSITSSRLESGLTLPNPKNEKAQVLRAFNTIIELIENEQLQVGGALTREAVESLNGLLFDKKVININKLVGVEGKSIPTLIAIDSVKAYLKQSEKDSIGVQKGLAKGVWQIIDFTFEKTVQDRLIVDSSISTSSGSIINYIRKLIQEPFVEFFTDTYGNKFNFMVRKAPFDEKGYHELVDKTINFENGVGVITSRDVYKEMLSFDDSEIFTWYILRPKGHLVGDVKFSLSYLPGIFIGEYVEIWGSRPNDFTLNYYPLISKVGTSKADNEFNFEKSVFQELKFLIDCSSYLPFTRKGVITIHGDRRFKVGTAIYYEPTDEYYQVKGVTQSFTRSGDLNERVTTLQVERGMRKKYFRGPRSYFKIFNTVFNEVKIRKKNKEGQVVFDRSVVKNWKINKDLLNFYLKRNQF